LHAANTRQKAGTSAIKCACVSQLCYPPARAD
jgi:hypothetical protein